MNFIEFESEQKLRGGYYTPPDIAAFLTSWVTELGPIRVLEPSCGDGAFLDALSRVTSAQLKSVLACELDPAEAAKAVARGRRLRPAPVTVIVDDFLEWFLRQRMNRPEFDAVVGNPPFIRYQYLSAAGQRRAEEVFHEFGLAFTRHANAWVPFVIASLALLRPGGRLAMVVPAELLHVLHANSLRGFLLRQCSRVLILDPDDLWFGEALQGVVLLLAEKRPSGDAKVCEVAIQRVRSRADLIPPAADCVRAATYFPSTVLNGKWMAGLLTSNERGLLARLATRPEVRRFGDVATVDVGIVTGANKFFLVPDAVVREFGLEPWAHPMFGRSDHVRGVVYDATSHAENRRQGLPTNFLWFGDQPLSELPLTVQRYIRRGESEGLDARYKCRIRSPWYKVPSVATSPVGMLKRSHHFPRLVLNELGAYTTDTAYRITPTGVRAADLVTGFVNSLTALSAELEGRSYGGGVLELVPSEIEKLLVPVTRLPAASLSRLDSAVRTAADPAALLAERDRAVLHPLGVTPTECDALCTAWMRLRLRRQRMTGGEPEVV